MTTDPREDPDYQAWLAERTAQPEPAPEPEPEPEPAAAEPGQWVPAEQQAGVVLPPFARQWPEAPPEPIAPAHGVRGLPGLGRGVSN